MLFYIYLLASNFCYGDHIILENQILFISTQDMPELFRKLRLAHIYRSIKFLTQLIQLKRVEGREGKKMVNTMKCINYDKFGNAN